MAMGDINWHNFWAGFAIGFISFSIGYIFGRLHRGSSTSPNPSQRE